MRKLYVKKSAVIAVIFALVTFLSSCSREMCRLTKSDKLNTAQSLTLSNAPVKHNAQVQPLKESVEVCNTPTLPENQPQTAKVVHPKKLNALIAKLQVKANTIIHKQAQNILKINTNPSLASQTNHQQTQSWLGLAVALLIVGLVLAFAGFGELGSLFWAIGIVVLVVGLIFFFLWLVAEAV